MSFTRFSIWDKDVANFLTALEKEGIGAVDIADMKKWFYTEAPLIIHKNEVTYFTKYQKDFLEISRQFPDMSGIGLGGYMLRVLNDLKTAFNNKFNNSVDPEDKDARYLNHEFNTFIINAVTGHDKFFEFRAQLSSSKLNEFVARNKKPDFEAQTNFINEQLEEAANHTDIDPALKIDLKNYLQYITEANVLMTPRTKQQSTLVDRSISGRDLRRYGQTPGNSPHVSPNLGTPSPVRSERNLMGRYSDNSGAGSPLSIIRSMAGGLRPSSSKENLASEHKPDEEPQIVTPRGLGMRSSSKS